MYGNGVPIGIVTLIMPLPLRIILLDQLRELSVCFVEAALSTMCGLIACLIV